MGLRITHVAGRPVGYSDQVARELLHPTDFIHDQRNELAVVTDHLIAQRLGPCDQRDGGFIHSTLSAAAVESVERRGDVKRMLTGDLQPVVKAAEQIPPSND